MHRSAHVQEAASRVIDLLEDYPHFVDLMLAYFYAHDYNDGFLNWDHNNKDDVGPMFENIELYALADKYGVTPLKEMAKNKFIKALNSFNHYDSRPFLNVLESIYNPCLCSDHETPRLSRYFSQAL